MKGIIVAALLLSSMGDCGSAQTIPTTPNLGLQLIPDGYQNWGVPYRTTMNTIDAKVAPLNNPVFTGTFTLPTSLNGCLFATNGVVTANGQLCGSGSGSVASVFGRTGAVIAAPNDYSFSQIAGTLNLATQVTGTLAAGNVATLNQNTTGNAATATALSTAGSATTVLHGNVTGAPSYSAVSLTADVSGILPVTNGGTGTSTPSLVQGTNITITGTWPNQTINATGSGMTWPAAAGIMVYAGGSAYGTSLTAPSGAIVGTTDTQTLSNKTYVGNGAAISNLNATNISSGTLADARLSSNVPLLNGTGLFFLHGLTSEDELRVFAPLSATSSNNYSSPDFRFEGSFWDGTTNQGDNWLVTDVLGTGTNPTSTLTFSHSGTSGTTVVSIPNLVVTGTCTGCGSGSTGISGQTLGYLPLAGSATTLTSASHLDDGITTAATITSTEPVAAPVFQGTGTTPSAISLPAGTGSIPALPANSAGLAAPATGGTSYLYKLPATAVAGILHAAAPGTVDGVNESALTSSLVSLTADVSGQLPNANLANPSTTVNGVTCTLGSTCSITASAGASAFTTLTDSSSVTWAAGAVALANATLTMVHTTATRALNITGMTSGTNGVLVIKQDATGGAALTLGTGCTWYLGGSSGFVASTTPTLTTTANAINILAFTYDGTNCYANVR